MPLEGDDELMRFNLLLKKPLINAIMLVGMVAIWIQFAPTQFGGQASYVMIAGASMEPVLQSGDLVIARQADEYKTGDVVTYQHPIVGPVIHRIIDMTATGYTLKGDNNDWIDSYTPKTAEIIGKSWIQIPSAASFLYELRTPLGLSLLSISIGCMVLMTLTAGKKMERSGSKMKLNKTQTQSHPSSFVGEGWLFTLAAILLGAVLLGVISFSRPHSNVVQEDLPYKHQGQFSYQGIGVSSVYDNGLIDSGDPIFHTLTSSFDVSFDYTFTSLVEATSSGRYRLLLEISEPNGWQREIELVPSTPFSGDGFSTSATIDLDNIQSLLQSLAARTGFNRSPFDIRVIPIVFTEASIAGHPIVEQFSPSLHFKLDDYQLYMDGANPFDDEIDPLNPVQVGMQPEFHRIPATMNILGLDIPVKSARWIAGIASSIALIGLGVILYPIIQTWRQGESSRIALQYSEILLDVDKLPKITAAQTIDVSSFLDLAKLSKSCNALILHRSLKGKHTYLLRTEESAFRFVLKDMPPEEQG